MNNCTRVEHRELQAVRATPFLVEDTVKQNPQVPLGVLQDDGPSEDTPSYAFLQLVGSFSHGRKTRAIENQITDENRFFDVGRPTNRVCKLLIRGGTNCSVVVKFET